MKEFEETKSEELTAIEDFLGYEIDPETLNDYYNLPNKNTAEKEELQGLIQNFWNAEEKRKENGFLDTKVIITNGLSQFEVNADVAEIAQKELTEIESKALYFNINLKGCNVPSLCGQFLNDWVEKYHAKRIV